MRETQTQTETETPNASDFTSHHVAFTKDGQRLSIPFESGTTISEQKGTILRPCGSVAVRHGPHAFGCSRDLRLGVILAGAVQFALLALFQPIALSIHLQNVHVVGQAIQ